ncbi:MAG: GntR family transcriptional regulator [Gammaproteobacteria bacterium]|nr:GntR family transcriptional regulator [Gammaproteobacteria bacterium]
MSRASDAVYTKIRESILTGEFPPGSRLKETELVELCGYSRTPVREALRRLASEDYILIQSNQGAEVKNWSHEEIRDLFHLRALLEGHAAAQAAKNISLIQLEKIHTAIIEMDAILHHCATRDLPIDEFLSLNQAIHNTVWEASGSQRLVTMLGRLIEQALVVRTARQFSRQRLERSQVHHQDLYDALQAGDADWAEAVMKGHIHAARDALLEPEL